MEMVALGFRKDTYSRGPLSTTYSNSTATIQQQWYRLQLDTITAEITN
jgi:hypothetical protein